MRQPLPLTLLTALTIGAMLLTTACSNEFYVIEGAGNTCGMAGAEKSIATVIYNYAGLN